MHARIEQRAFFANTGLPTFTLTPVWSAHGLLMGFEVWDGPELVGHIPFDDDCREVLKEVSEVLV